MTTSRRSTTRLPSRRSVKEHERLAGSARPDPLAGRASTEPRPGEARRWREPAYSRAQDGKRALPEVQDSAGGDEQHDDARRCRGRTPRVTRVSSFAVTNRSAGLFYTIEKHINVRDVNRARQKHQLSLKMSKLQTEELMRILALVSSRPIVDAVLLIRPRSRDSRPNRLPPGGRRRHRGDWRRDESKALLRASR